MLFRRHGPFLQKRAKEFRSGEVDNYAARE